MEKEENIPSIVDRLLKHYRECRKIDFKPDLKALQSLLEMGFEEKNIIQALKITENNQINAVSNLYIILTLLYFKCIFCFSVNGYLEKINII